jgi:uroporphyrin-III C-methyltransferase
VLAPGIRVDHLARPRAVARGDVVVHDRLAAAELLREVKPEARLIDAGKAPGRVMLEQSEIHELLVKEARAGRAVVRLKGGDPFVFGRGFEELAACRAAGVECEVVPGVSSAIAGPAAAGIPVTLRGTARSFAVVTAHSESAGSPSAAGADSNDWSALARIDTVVVLMGRARLQDVAAKLIAGGRSPATPVAVIESASTPQQRVTRVSLAGWEPCVRPRPRPHAWAARRRVRRRWSWSARSRAWRGRGRAAPSPDAACC